MTTIDALGRARIEVWRSTGRCCRQRWCRMRRCRHAGWGDSSSSSSSSTADIGTTVTVREIETVEEWTSQRLAAETELGRQQHATCIIAHQQVLHFLVCDAHSQASNIYAKSTPHQVFIEIILTDFQCSFTITFYILKEICNKAIIKVPYTPTVLWNINVRKLAQVANQRILWHHFFAQKNEI